MVWAVVALLAVVWFLLLIGQQAPIFGWFLYSPSPRRSSHTSCSSRDAPSDQRLRPAGPVP
jgi:hypothetical protein